MAMENTMIFVVCSTLVLLCSTSAYAQKAGSPPPFSPTPAPAPAPEHVNLTELLAVAGPFHTFLNYLVSTKVIETLQNQANNTEGGLALFVPKDKAFSSLKNPSLSNLTADQLKSLCLFHALPHYYSLADFKNLSQVSPVNTFAGGSYTLNFTDNSGSVLIGSGWTNTKVSSSVHSTDPVAIYQVDKVLLPEAIFGTDIPPTPAPAPSPDIAPTADAPNADGGSVSSPSTSTPSSSYRINFKLLCFGSLGWISLVLLRENLFTNLIYVKRYIHSDYFDFFKPFCESYDVLILCMRWNIMSYIYVFSKNCIAPYELYLLSLLVNLHQLFNQSIHSILALFMIQLPKYSSKLKKIKIKIRMFKKIFPTTLASYHHQAMKRFRRHWPFDLQRCTMTIIITKY